MNLGGRSRIRLRMRLRTSPAELGRQNGVVTNPPDKVARQPADERDRAVREEDELLGERTRQNWEGVSPWTVVDAASEGGKTRDQAPLVMTLRLIGSNQALQAELVDSRKSSEKLAGEQSSRLADLIMSNGELKAELVKSRESVERLTKRAIAWTIVLAVLTIALVALTVILVQRADAPSPATHTTPTAPASSPSHTASPHASPHLLELHPRPAPHRGELRSSLRVSVPAVAGMSR